jgi:hypothetical protein
MTVKTFSPPMAKKEWEPLGRATVGKDILELLSSAMYIDPLTIYREYVQNAVDSIEDAQRHGYLAADRGEIDIAIDRVNRTIRIRDNGLGVRKENFESQLGTFGGSLKRGTLRRGFRGVGRLAGLGYCQELTFRTRPEGQKHISEMKWDCRKIKSLLRDTEGQCTLEDLLAQVVSVRHSRTPDEAGSFFEVELKGVLRHKNDLLLNPLGIYGYLAEIAPVPFHPEFSFGPEITEFLGESVAMGDVGISITGVDGPVYRAYRDAIIIDGNLYDSLRDLEFREIPAHDDGTAALMWTLNHGYKGTIPDARIRGLRARCGNVQIGDNDIFAEYFPEPRFNAWSVGEVHILDQRIIPNGRRDHFEIGVHFENITNHVAPLARRIAGMCRKSSQVRNREQEFSRLESVVEERLSMLSRNILSPSAQNQLRRQILSDSTKLEKLARNLLFSPALHGELVDRAALVTERIKKLPGGSRNILPKKSSVKVNAYKEVFALLYECSDDKAAAQILIDKILQRMAE